MKAYLAKDSSGQILQICNRDSWSEPTILSNGFEKSIKHHQKAFRPEVKVYHLALLHAVQPK